MRYYTREEVLRASGARAEDLAELQSMGLIVPVRPWRLLGPRPERFTEDQLAFVRWLIEARGRAACMGQVRRTEA